MPDVFRSCFLKEKAHKNAALFQNGVIFVYAISRFFKILFRTPWNIFISVSETPA